MKHIFLLLVAIPTLFSCGQKGSAPKITGDHAIFENFWKDFKTAILAKDKETVFALTKMPFINKNNGKLDEMLSSKNHEEFLSKYDALFFEGILSAIRNDEYEMNERYNINNEGYNINVDGISPKNSEKSSGNAYIITSNTNIEEKGQVRLIFGKIIDGKYRLWWGTFRN